MSVKDRLEIICVTYNRKRFLESTLQSLFANNSPVKDFDITFLNNCSTDGTGDVIEKYRKEHSNITHIVNNKNIGGNANIANAFSMAKKEYVWVICDDDVYDWSNWGEVEKAISENHDVIVVDNEHIMYPDEPLDIIFQLSFLPSGIYKTKNIDVNVLRNIYDNISNWFPHLPVGLNIVNTSKDFYILKDCIVRNGQAIRYIKKEKMSPDSLWRDNDDKKIYPESKYSNWNVNYIKSLALLNGKNKSIGKAVRLAMKHPPVGIAKDLFHFCKQIVDVSKKCSFCANLFYDVYYKVNLPMKILLMWHKYFYWLNIFYMTERGIYIHLWKLKTKIIPFRYQKEENKNDCEE